MSKIHVIIPVYNAKRFLREAVDSVLNQPYKDIDIVLVNDGSTDGSDVLCDEIASNEERVSVIHQANAGVSAARNAGIECVLKQCENEDYIAFLDADDIWVPNALTEDIAKGMVCKNAIYAFGGMRCVETMSHFSVPYTYTPSVCNGSDAIWKYKGEFCANIYSVALIKQWNIRFIKGLKYSEDKIFQMQCTYLSTEVQYLPEILFVYRNNPASAMNRQSTITPIDKYLPIINSWVKSDDFLNSYESISGKHICAGYVLAGIYFMDMAADHYKRWGKRSEIEKVFREHPYFYLFEQMRPKDVSTLQYKNHNLLLKHPLLFKWKYNLIGAAEYIVRLLLSPSPLQKWWIHRRYPLTQMPTND